MQNKYRVSIIRKSWVQAILVFCSVQVVFIFMERTGWIPNLRDFEGKFLGNVMNSLNNEWFSIYNTAFFNLVTLILGIVLLCQVGFALVRLLLQKKSS